jgi:PPM family protein phosphatase
MAEAADDITIIGGIGPHRPQTPQAPAPPPDLDPIPAAKVPTEELDADVLTKGWAAISAQRPAKHAVLSWAARTDMGRVREHNEDKFDFYDPDEPTQLAVRGRLFAVADGMGGHTAGQVASEWALKTLVRNYYAPTAPPDTEAALRNALADANTLIFNASQQFEKANGMGTTVVAAVVKEGTLTVAHIGDSRAYLKRSGEPLRQITVDHSWVEEQVRRGMMSRADAEASPYRNFITRSVGVDASVEADVTVAELGAGDLVLLCSDGLSNYLDEDALDAIIAEKSPSQAAFDLVDAALVAGGKDNITVLLFKVRAIIPYSG